MRLFVYSLVNCRIFWIGLHSAMYQPHQILTGESSWVRVGSVSDFPKDGGAAVLYGKSQLAVYNVVRRNVGTF